MARDLDLRHHADVTLGGERDDLADLVLGVEERPVFARRTFGNGIEQMLVRLGIRTLRGDRGQFRVAVNLDTPALVVGEVPVENIELVLRHQREEAFHGLHAEEVAAFVEHQPAPPERREVLDLYTGEHHGTTTMHRQLEERLARIERTRSVRALHRNSVRRDGEPVTFRRQRGVTALRDGRIRDRAAEHPLLLHDPLRRGDEPHRHVPRYVECAIGKIKQPLPVPARDSVLPRAAHIAKVRTNRRP